MKKDLRTPESPWAKEYYGAIHNLTELDEQIKLLQSRRKAVLNEVPTGVYHLSETNQRVVIRRVVGSSVSVKLLSRWVSREVIDRCRTRRVSRCVRREILNREL